MGSTPHTRDSATRGRQCDNLRLDGVIVTHQPDAEEVVDETAEFGLRQAKLVRRRGVVRTVERRNRCSVGSEVWRSWGLVRPPPDRPDAGGGVYF